MTTGHCCDGILTVSGNGTEFALTINIQMRSYTTHLAPGHSDKRHVTKFTKKKKDSFCLNHMDLVTGMKALTTSLARIQVLSSRVEM